jgi:hypothetical protein
VLGENLIVETRISQPNTSDAATHAAELAHLDLDLVVAGSLIKARQWLLDVIAAGAPFQALIVREQSRFSRCDGDDEAFTKLKGGEAD